MVHSSQLNTHSISIHMYITIQYIINLSHTLNLNHNGIIPKQHVITPHESYTHHTILIYTWHKHRLYLWTMQYTHLLNYFQNHFNSWPTQSDMERWPVWWHRKSLIKLWVIISLLFLYQHESHLIYVEHFVDVTGLLTRRDDTRQLCSPWSWGYTQYCHWATGAPRSYSSYRKWCYNRLILWTDTMFFHHIFPTVPLPPSTHNSWLR